MPADSRQPAGRRPRFGRVDPFCWFAVAAFLLIAVVGVLAQTIALTIGAVVAGVALVLFDARVNRPEAPEEPIDEYERPSRPPAPPRNQARPPGGMQPERGQADRNRRPPATRVPQDGRTELNPRSTPQRVPPRQRPDPRGR